MKQLKSVLLTLSLLLTTIALLFQLTLVVLDVTGNHHLTNKIKSYAYSVLNTN